MASKYNTTVYLSEAVYNCLAPTFGREVSVCSSDGRWSTVDLHCSMTCTEPPTISNGTLSEMLVQRSSRGINRDSLWWATCKQNFTYLGPRIVKCLQNNDGTGTWKGHEEAECVQTVFVNKEPPFTVECRNDKMDYFNNLTACANGTIVNSFYKYARFRFANYVDGRYTIPIRVVFDLKEKHVIVQQVDQLSGAVTIRRVDVNKKRGDIMSVCLRVNFKQRLLEAFLDGILLTSLFEERDSFFPENTTCIFEVRGDFHIDVATLVYQESY